MSNAFLGNISHFLCTEVDIISAPVLHKNLSIVHKKYAQTVATSNQESPYALMNLSLTLSACKLPSQIESANSQSFTKMISGRKWCHSNRKSVVILSKSGEN